MTAPRTETDPSRPIRGTGDARRRYRDANLDATIVQVLQGDCYVTAAPDEVLTTVLGSCVSACIRDPVIRCGGMNHFLLPAGHDMSEADLTMASLRYGGFAMEKLINSVMAAGGSRDRLEIKVFGGGNVMKGLSKIGNRNAEFVEEYLKAEGFRIAAKHLRGDWPRKIQFFPHSGQVRMRELKDNTAERLFQQEVRAAPRVASTPTSGSIELFD